MPAATRQRPRDASKGDRKRGGVTRVVVASDIRLYRDGIAELLSRDEQFAVLGTADSGEGALGICLELSPDVALVDMGTPGGHGAVRAVCETVPDVKVVGLAVEESEPFILACAESGVAAFVLRDASIDELIATLKGVAMGEFHTSPRVAASLLRRVGSMTDHGAEPLAGRLTHRELEIVQLIDQGMTNKEIAKLLSIQLSTVKNHVHNILEKLKLHRRAQAASVMAGRITPRA